MDLMKLLAKRKVYKYCPGGHVAYQNYLIWLLFILQAMLNVPLSAYERYLPSLNFLVKL